jgi:hypothetical protein
MGYVTLQHPKLNMASYGVLLIVMGFINICMSIWVCVFLSFGAIKRFAAKLGGSDLMIFYGRISMLRSTWL